MPQKIYQIVHNYIFFKKEHGANHYTILAMSLWNYTNHYCVIVLIALLAKSACFVCFETTELIPTRKWQLVMWVRMDFTMLWYCKRPWDNTVNTIKRCLNCFLCEMCNAWIKAYWSVGRCLITVLRTCFAVCAHKLAVSDNILYWLILMNCIYIWKAIFFSSLFVLNMSKDPQIWCFVMNKKRWSEKLLKEVFECIPTSPLVYRFLCWL